MSLVKSLLLYLLPLLSLTACQRAPDAALDTSARTVVTMLHYFTGTMGQNMDEVTRSFNAHNPRYELKSTLLQRPSFKTSMQNSLKVGHPPDVYSSRVGAPTAAIVPDLEPLDDIWQQAKLDEQFLPEVVRAASVYQGHKYLIPLTRYDVLFFYNKKLFDAHKLQPPRTWDEFLAVCATLKAKGVTPIALGTQNRWPAQLWFDMLLLRTAPLEFREQLMQGQVRYDDPRVTAVFARWASLLNKGYFNPDAHRLTWHKGANQMVFKGEAAMTLMGSWGMDYPPKNEQQWVMGKDYDVFPFPRIRDDVPQVALGSMDGLVLPKKAINKQGAKEVLTYLASQAQQQALTHNSGALAPTAQVPRTAYSDMQQHLFDHIDPGTNFVFLFDMSTPDVVADLGLDAFQEFLALPAAYPKILNRLAQSAAAYFQANPHH